MSEREEPTKGSSWIAVGRVVRPRGVRGEVLVELLTDFPQRFETLDQVQLRFPDGRVESRRLEDVWFHKGRAVVRFQGAQRYEDAEQVVHAAVEIPEEELVELPEGTYFDFQLIGCQVVTESGVPVGEVTSILKIQGNNLLVVHGGRETLIPAREPICRKIDVEARRIEVSLPEGLLDING